MDPGIDDAVALLCLPAMKDIEAVGVSTVAGNVDVSRTTKNALRICEFLGLKLKVYKGSSRPMIRPLQTSAHIHGFDGLGGVNLPEPKRVPEALPGPMAMVEAARAHPKNLTLVATGPLTNVAIACMLDLDFPKRVKQLVLMGGAFGLTPQGTGNVTNFAEYNIFADPEAASLVLGSFDDVTCVGLDVTMDPDVLIKQGELDRLKSSGSKKAQLAAELMSFSVGRIGYFAPHDPLALYSVHDNQVLSFEKKVVVVNTGGDIERGRTIPVEALVGKPKAKIASGVDGARFKEELLNLLIA
jgi:purine nucleosidase